jgi:hypothetical protein
MSVPRFLAEHSRVWREIQKLKKLKFIAQIDPLMYLLFDFPPQFLCEK